MVPWRRIFTKRLGTMQSVRLVRRRPVAIKALAMENVQLKSAVATQEAVNAEQRKRLEALTARFEEQDARIQKVSAQLQLRKPTQSLARNIP
jgi:predicted phage gp36 major capsid-like protein